MDAPSTSSRSYWVAGLVVAVAAAAIAAAGSREYAGGWNDGSRLATIEAIVDYHTLAIDKSIFVKPASAQPSVSGSPYPKDDPALRESGTGDKMYIDGHFYSDKSPVPAVALAAVYQVWQWVSGITAREAPSTFCYGMTLVSSGLAYVVAACCIFLIGMRLGLSVPLSAALTASFALATVALPYARHVNNHILLLGVTSALMLAFLRLGEESRAGCATWGQVACIGGLAGLGYTIDLGAGPVLLVCALALVISRCRGVGGIAAFVLAALPWLALHHWANYIVGGTFGPANSVPEYFQWPGCVFNAQTMTGSWNHGSVAHFLTYAAALLVGKSGFLCYNLALFIALPAIVILLVHRTRELPEVLFAGFFCGGTWLAYALTSTNYSGQCCSIRWFVPLLGPAFFVLGVFLREFPRYRPDFLILSAWGAVIAGIAWTKGPWMQHMLPGYWPLEGAALLSWVGYRAWRRRAEKASGAAGQAAPEDLAQAA